MWHLCCTANPSDRHGRIGNTAAARDDRLDLQYSTNATSLTTGTWYDVDLLDCINKVKTATSAGALDGDSAANRTAVSGNITGLTIANGASFWIRWNDFNASGADDGLAVDDFNLTPTVSTSDVAPVVNSTVPTNNAPNVAASSDLTVNFSEPVTVTGAWYAISCASTGVHTAVVSGGPQSNTLNPDSDFGAGESCTVTIYAPQVADQDGTVNYMATDYTWSFTVAGAAQACSQLFFSEYVEGTSNNKALEIFNGTASAVSLSGYKVELYSNGSPTPTTTANLSGSLAAGDVYVIANSAAVAAITDMADLISGVTNFNGDDAIALKYNDTIIDVIGQIGTDPGTQWGSGLTSTLDHTLRRKLTVSAGDANGSDAFDPAAEWDGYAIDTFDGLGVHTASCGGDAAPAVTSTSPSDGATGVATTANIMVNFSEAVTVSGTWYAISCPTSGAHTAAVTGGPASFTLNPDTNFTDGETCTVTIYAAQVADQDAEDPPDTMAADRVFSFGVGGAAAPCSTIPTIQGTATRRPAWVTAPTSRGASPASPPMVSTSRTWPATVTRLLLTASMPTSLPPGRTRATSSSATWCKVSGNVTEFYNTTEFAHKGADPLVGEQDRLLHGARGGRGRPHHRSGRRPDVALRAVRGDAGQHELPRLDRRADEALHLPLRVRRPRAGLCGFREQHPGLQPGVRARLHGLPGHQLHLRRAESEPARRGFRR